LADKKNLVFELVMQGEIPKCLFGDDVRLRQVLLNMLSNAIKYTDKGSVRFSVNITDNNIKFSITDTGIGIKEEDISKLFEAFSQADMQKNRKREGAGLGLAITKSLIEMMGGQITVDSVYGQGSIFRAIIPKILGEETLISSARGNESVIYAPDAKILVVDDNKIDLNVAVGLLQLFKITAETAASGEQAIEMTGKKQYDIIFMDHMMPGMDGVETTRKIREMGINTPIIALTANAIEGSKEKFLAAGMNDLLTKPIKRELLIKALVDWIPAEKLLEPPVETDSSDKSGDKSEDKSADENEAAPDGEFWERIEQIKDLSVQTGLDRISGQKDVYKKSLQLMTKEIEKCDKNLNKFLAAGDMRNFCVEVHGVKGSLANIGALDLASQARELETASGNEDADFCAVNLHSFLKDLNSLNSNITEALEKDNQNRGPVVIPPELPAILEKMTNAFDEMDFWAIDEAIENVDALNPSGALKDETDKIKDAVLVMDYDGALDVIRSLLK